MSNLITAVIRSWSYAPPLTPPPGVMFAAVFLRHMRRPEWAGLTPPGGPVRFIITQSDPKLIVMGWWITVVTVMHGRGLTVPVRLRVGHLVVLLVEAVQVGELGQQLKDAVPVVLQRGHLTAVQVQALQVLQVLLQNAWNTRKTSYRSSACYRTARTRPAMPAGVSLLVPSRTHQNLQAVQLLDLVPAQVQVRQVGTFLSQTVQTSSNDVVAHLQL